MTGLCMAYERPLGGLATPRQCTGLTFSKATVEPWS
jgi:hypothetical protein